MAKIKYLARESLNRLSKNLFTEDRCKEIVNLLDSNPDWRVAQVTDNGNSYIIMTTVRRQKILEREDTDNAFLHNLFDEVEKMVFEQAEQDGFDTSQLEIDILQFIRSDQSDFFIKHSDSKENLPRAYSMIISFGQDYTGGEIEFFNEEGSDPIIHHLEAGSGISYMPLLYSQHHRVLRGTNYMALCILKRNKDAQDKFIKSK